MVEAEVEPPRVKLNERLATSLTVTDDVFVVEATRLGVRYCDSDTNAESLDENSELIVAEPV